MYHSAQTRLRLTVFGTSGYTCYIDKKNNTEHLEAISSIFGWYRKAAQFCVYLADVSTHEGKENASARALSLGGDLQEKAMVQARLDACELPAPTLMDFSAEGERLRSKITVEVLEMEPNMACSQNELTRATIVSRSRTLISRR
jgi:hypothetical protein